MNPTPSMMQFHIRHKQARRRIMAAGKRPEAREPTIEQAAVRALQEAQREVSELKAKVAELESKTLTDAIQSSPRPSVQAIAKVVANAHGLTVSTLLSRRRFRPIVNARHHLIWALHNIRPDLSFPMIARDIGGYDHSTIMYAVKRWPEIASKYGSEVAQVNAALGLDNEMLPRDGEAPLT